MDGPNEYIIHGPVPLIPVIESTAGQQLFDALNRYKHLSAALISAETQEVLSYKKILESCCQLACSLSKYGLTFGNVVGILSENSVYYYIPVFASLFLGVTVAPLSPHYIKNELCHAVNISKPQVLFCSRHTMKKALKLQQVFKFITKIVVMDGTNSTNEVESLDHFMKRSIPVNNFNPVRFDPNENVALIMCTSGTTGLPKGAMITHKNLSIRFAQFKDPILGLTNEPTTTVLSVLPMHHIGGFGFNLAYLVSGCCNIIMQRYSAELFLKLIQNNKVDNCFVAPRIMTFLAKSPLVKKYDLSSLREIGCGAAPLSKEIIVKVLERLPCLREVRQAYGLTETTLVVTFSPIGDAKIGSIGKLYPFMSAKIIDITTNQTLGPYHQGELCFKGGLIMKGYVGNKTETEKMIREDGWLHTGDIGYYDKDQHFFVVGRLKELIKYNGYQVSPVELESLLLQHPKIRDAAVIGVDNELAGQLPRAYIVRQPNVMLTELEVSKFIADQVSQQKHLRGGVVFIDKIPRNPSGKIERKRLSELSRKMTSKM